MNKHREIIKIVAIYVLFGFSWIYLSDLAIGWFVHDPETATRISIFKGLLFIAITSVLLYSLIVRLSGKLNQSLQALRETEDRLNLLVKNSSDSLVIVNADGSQRYVSPAAERITGFSVTELEGRTLDTLIHPDDMEGIRAAWNEAVEHPEKTVTVQYRHIHKTKRWVFFEAVAQSFLSEPAINGIIASVRDISERRKAEEAITLTNKLMQTVINTAPVRIFFKDRNLHYLGCNRAFARDAGMERPEDLIGKDDYQLVWKAQAEMYRADDFAVIESGEAKLAYDEPQTTPDGGLIWLRTSKVPLRNESNSIIGVLGMYDDITDRKRVESELRESEDKFSQTFKSSPDAININRLDDGLYVDINEGFTRLTGYTRDEVIGKTSLELDIWHDPNDRRRLVQAIREKGHYENLEAQFRRKDGGLIIALMSARIIFLKGVPHLVSVTRDITERKVHEKEQLKIEKLESLGILAGGIAHDFNNILTGIMGNISFAKVFLDAAHKANKPLLEAEKAVGRAGELAHQLLTFARGGEPIKKVVSLQHIVSEALTFILHGSNVKGTVDIPDTIHAFEADEGQLSQVFQNIIINATQAMPGGGFLTISARNEMLGADNGLSLSPGPYVRVILADQGCGISESDQKKIFDPYFTTKSAGIGLGLSSVHSIVNRHGGHIEVSSAMAKGTTFTIYLPSTGKVFPDSGPETAEFTKGDHQGGSILVMDDDEMIRDLAASILTHLGYKVTTCADGDEAIELFKASNVSGAPYLACFVDLTIPGGLGGKEVARQILSAYPNACLVVSSGYSNDPIMSNFEKFGFRGAIAKPYSMHEFEKVLGAVLSGRLDRLA
jgi:PAS domain S-box-containing protein